MARRVTFGRPRKKRGKGSVPDFNFGFNAMTKGQKKAFRRKHGGKGGGS